MRQFLWPSKPCKMCSTSKIFQYLIYPTYNMYNTYISNILYIILLHELFTGRLGQIYIFSWFEKCSNRLYFVFLQVCLFPKRNTFCVFPAHKLLPNPYSNVILLQHKHSTEKHFFTKNFEKLFV